MIEWTEWIEHDGTGRPVPVGTEVEGILERHPIVAPIFGQFCIRQGVAGEGLGHAWNWAHWGMPAPDGGVYSRIVRYRCRRYARAREMITRFSGEIDVREDA